MTSFQVIDSAEARAEARAEDTIDSYFTGDVPEIPKEILAEYVNDVTVDDLDKNAKCNKLLRKAVQVGDIDLVELILTIAADQGRNMIIYKPGFTGEFLNI